MVTRFFYLAASVTALSVSTQAYAADSFVNTVNFDSAGALTASALNATIASSHMVFQPGAGTVIEGNSVKNSFNNTFGVVSVLQNSGSNSNVQQSIAVKADSLSATVSQK